MTGPLRIRIRHADRPLQVGSRIAMALCLGPIQVPWTVRVRAMQPPTFFTDEQAAGEGPMRRWVHTHRFEPVGEQATRVIDELEYELPFGALGRVVGTLFGNLGMRLTFAQRAAATRKLLEQPHE